MKFVLFIVVLICFNIFTVQTRSSFNLRSDSDDTDKYFMEPMDYAKLLSFVKDRKNPSSKQLDEYQDHDQQTFSLNDQQIFQKGKSSNNYGRKSHWDTFFGRK